MRNGVFFPFIFLTIFTPKYNLNKFFNNPFILFVLILCLLIWFVNFDSELLARLMAENMNMLIKILVKQNIRNYVVSDVASYNNILLHKVILKVCLSDWP